jgi:parallel beta-helix repeat protein
MKLRTVSLKAVIITVVFLFSFLPFSRDAETHAAFHYSDAIPSPDFTRTLTNNVVGLSASPGINETSEYLIGKVAVGVVLLESNGAIDPSTENWTTARESQVVNKIQSGLSWLANYYPDAHVSFVYDIHYRVPTSYEPISHSSSFQVNWMREAMTYLGYPGSNYWVQIRAYVNALRLSLNRDWAFSIFVVDSYNDVDGCFTDGYSSYAYLGGPFLVMTYDNDGYGIGHMDYVVAHETCHIFYATDEYDGSTDVSGYLGVEDNEGSGDMMDAPNTWWLCTNSMEQLGWRDSDGDGIQDILDTFPDTSLTPYSPDPTNKPTLTYEGNVTVVPYPNSNPFGAGRNVSINTITSVEYRVDNGAWQNAFAEDGSFDQAEEGFYFVTQPLSKGPHVIQTRGVNSVGNIETSYATDYVERSSTSIYVPVDYSTIQGSINAAYTGDTIFVSPGTYYENLVVNKTVSLIGENASTTVLNGGGGTVITITANNSRIFGFTITKGGTGVYIRGVNCTVENSNIVSNTYYGIYLPFMVEISRSGNWSILGNTITNNSLSGVVFAGAYSHICTLNLEVFGNAITGSLSGIRIGWARNMNISKNTVSNNTYGIQMEICGAANITENILTHNTQAIYFKGLDGGDSQLGASIVTRNNVTDNIAGIVLAWGMWSPYGGLVLSEDNDLAYNDIMANSGDALSLVGSSNNRISDNVISANGGSGINLESFYYFGAYQTDPERGEYQSSNNTIFGNSIEANMYGLHCLNSSENRVYNSNFVANAENVYTENSVNMWDDSYVLGGNFWSDFVDTDLYGGSGQDVFGSDGVWDHPFQLDENNQDRYPFSKAYPWDPHDIGITGLMPSKTMIAEGDRLFITVVLFNYGDYIEVFNVTLFVNSFSIRRWTGVTLASRSSMILSIEVDLARGSYTFSTDASPVLGETDTSDNARISSLVRVAPRGHASNFYSKPIIL